MGYDPFRELSTRIIYGQNHKNPHIMRISLIIVGRKDKEEQIMGRSSELKPSKELAAFLRGMHCTMDDIKRPAHDGHETPLHIAAKAGNIALARELLALGADINAVKLLVGSTPLAEAIRNRQDEMVQFLLENGADPNAGDGSLLDEAVMSCDEHLVELLRRYGGKGTLDADFHIDPQVLERVRTAAMEGRNAVDIADELNRDRVPPLRGRDPWDYVMVTTALTLAVKRAAAGMPPSPKLGGCLHMTIDGKDLLFEITDAAYGINYREDEPDMIEFCGDDVSVSIVVPSGPLKEAGHEEDFASLAGAELNLRDWSSCFENPYIILPGGVRLAIAGGKIKIETAESLSLPFGGGERLAHGRIAARMEMTVTEHGARKSYSGRLDLAFGIA